MSTYPRDMVNTVSTQVSKYPVAITSTTNGTGLDMVETYGLCTAYQLVSTVSGTSPTLDGKIQESDDNSTFTDISGATFTQVTASSNLQIISFQRTKRYVRWSGTIAGTSPSFIVGALIQAGEVVAYS